MRLTFVKTIADAMVSPGLNELTEIVRGGSIGKDNNFNSRKRKFAAGLLFCAGDIVALTLSVLISVLIRNFIFPDNPAEPENLALLSTAVFIAPILFLAFRLYPGFGTDIITEIRNTSAALTTVWFGLAGAGFAVKTGGDLSRLTLAFSWIISLAAIPSARSAVRRIFSGASWWGIPVMIIGAGNTGEKIIRSLLDNPRIGLRPLVAVDDDNDKWGYNSGVPVVGGLDAVPGLAKELSLSHAIFAMPKVDSELRNDIISRISKHFDHSLVIPDSFFGKSIWMTAGNFGGMFAYEMNNNILNLTARVFKRVFDILSVTVLGILSLPLMTVLTVLAFIDSKGKPFFRQERMGINNTVFDIIKFRTMHDEAESRLDDLLSESDDYRREYETYHKITDDPRITGLGKFLRKYSLDELPQLWNVLRGEMSLIGPRAYIPAEKCDMLGREQEVLRVKPGISGLWQVTNRNSDFETRIYTDLYYISNWSIFMDIYIFARTISVVLLGMGS